MKTTSFALMLFLALSLPAEAAGVSGAGMSLAWGLPFAGLLLSIALMPLLAGPIWHHHYGKIAAGWALLLVLPFAAVFGLGVAASEVWHILLQEYIPFIALLLALYVTGGGVLLKGTYSCNKICQTSEAATPSPNTTAKGSTSSKAQPAAILP